MEFKFKKSFEHDFKKLKNKNLAKAILECIQKVSEDQTINNISNLKKKFQVTNQHTESELVIIALELLE